MFVYTHLIVVISLVFCSQCDEDLYHSFGYESYEDIGYYNYHEALVSWYDARRICQQEGAHLLILNSDKEARVLGPVIRSRGLKATFSGFHDIYNEGKFVTIFGDSLNETGYTTWYEDYPVISNNSQCGGVMYDGTLTNLPCDMLGPFFCEQEEKSVFDTSESVQIFHYEAETWQDAFMICQDGGGHLSIVNDWVELGEIIGIFNSAKNDLIDAESADYLIVGFHSQFSNGEYLTVEDEPLSATGYVHWSEKEPNSDGKCGALATAGDNIGLADIPCDKKYAFVCELKRLS